jgi:hypothetical protein
MSETVHYKGKLNLIIKTSNVEFLEDVCKGLCNKHGLEELDGYDSWSEILQNELYDEYVEIEDKHDNVSIFEVVSRVDVDEYEMFNITQIEDEEYEYEVMYYNGGMGLSEAIEEALNRLEK